MPAGSWPPMASNQQGTRSPGPWTSCCSEPDQGPGEPGRPARKPGAKDRRVAARTRATAQPAWPRPEPLAAPAGGSEPAETPGEPPEDRLADVVPLAVFDAREEAGKWW